MDNQFESNNSNDFETMYVSNTYIDIAEHFSSTRYAHWNLVKKYLENLQNNHDNLALGDNKNFLDFGCGNGKYLSLLKKNFNIYALDNCEKLLNIVNKSYPNVKIIKSDVCEDLEYMNFIPGYFDSIISVAVIHHLSTEYRRTKALENIFMLLKSGGTCLITVWTTIIDKSKFKKLSYPGDYLIPWNNKYQRYYHLFEFDELEKLINKTNLDNNIEILSKEVECNNIIYIIKKK
jgi:tRNA (uracil-5-)-methyltransferase TRM9